MQAEMELHGFAPCTQRTYVAWMKRLVSQQRVPADQITEQQIREYLSGLSRRGLSSSSINQAISAVRFLPGALGVVAALSCATTATDLARPPRTRVLLCLGIALFAWLGLALLVVITARRR
jgi:hypothetical protein